MWPESPLINQKIMKPDRALIVRKPWIDLILDEGKDMEMRSRKTKIHGQIGLIEAGSGLIMGEIRMTDEYCDFECPFRDA